MPKKAIVLLSGGINSATTLAIAKAQGYECISVTFDYGQRLLKELEAAKYLSGYFGCLEHHPIDLTSIAFSGTALVDKQMAMPEGVSQTTRPVTYVPARNTIFISIALALAEMNVATAIFSGSSQGDYADYPDCREAYFQAWDRLMKLATCATTNGLGIGLQTPVLYLSKAQIIQTGLNLNVPFEWTQSCYVPLENNAPCGICSSCLERADAFAILGIADPIHQVF